MQFKNIWAFFKSFLEDGINFLKYIYAIDVMKVLWRMAWSFCF